MDTLATVLRQALRLCLVLAACCAPAGAAAPSGPPLQAFLPAQGVVEAEYVELEPDPGWADYGRRIREAGEKNPEFFRELRAKMQKEGLKRTPYHPNFGVSKKEYAHYGQPMNQYRVALRQPIRLKRSAQGDRVLLEHEGKGLMITQLDVDPGKTTVRTALETLPLSAYVPGMDQASVLPGRHRGYHFVTPDASIREHKRRESVLIGDLLDEKAGIMHYAVYAGGKEKRCYVRFPKAATP